MSTINATNSSMRETLRERSGFGTPTDVANGARSAGAAKNGRDPSSTVELSDHAKAILAKAQQDQVVADQLISYFQTLKNGRNAPVGTQGTSGGTPSKSDGSGQIADVKAWAKLDVFRNAANGVADDQIRALVRDGELPQLPALDDAQWNQLSEAEQNVYGTVRALQGLYGSMPETLSQALSDHVTTVLETYPDDISRMESGLASGTLKAEDGWEDIIASRKAELAAAQQGTMQIHAVNDPALVRTENEFTVTREGSGWSARGITVNANFPALYETYGTTNVRPGSSPYTGDFVITW